MFKVTLWSFRFVLGFLLFPYAFGSLLLWHTSTSFGSYLFISISCHFRTEVLYDLGVWTCVMDFAMGACKVSGSTPFTSWKPTIIFPQGGLVYFGFCIHHLPSLSSSSSSWYSTSSGFSNPLLPTSSSSSLRFLLLPNIIITKKGTNIKRRLKPYSHDVWSFELWWSYSFLLAIKWSNENGKERRKHLSTINI